jgi:hypothetical protein
LTITTLPPTAVLDAEVAADVVFDVVVVELEPQAAASKHDVTSNAAQVNRFITPSVPVSTIASYSESARIRRRDLPGHDQLLSPFGKRLNKSDYIALAVRIQA